ncbi:MAG: hypothetical protein RR989_05525, partial [Ruthenibacterium sp.]
MKLSKNNVFFRLFYEMAGLHNLYKSCIMGNRVLTRYLGGKMKMKLKRTIAMLLVAGMMLSIVPAFAA